jgi:orotate phosphoribosyltransferase
MQAVGGVRARGAIVNKIITFVDRLEGAADKLGKEGIELVGPLYEARFAGVRARNVRSRELPALLEEQKQSRFRCAGSTSDARMRSP